MSRREEYVGVRVIDHVESDGPSYSQWLTYEPIVRCRDCEHGRSPQQGLPWMCIRNCCARFPIEPDGFCAWGERRDE